MKHTMMKVLSVVMVLTMLVSTLGSMTLSFATDCEHTNATSIKSVDATCGTYGYTLYECDDCGEEFIADVTDKLAEHTDLEVIPATDATCTSPAKTEQSVCHTCGWTEGGSIVPGSTALEHVLEYYVTDPTCGEGAVLMERCTNCDLDRKVVGLPGGNPDKQHAYDWEIIEDPTCKDDGTANYVCADCGDILYEDVKVVIAAGQHRWEAVSEGECNTKYIDGYVCLDCGTVKAGTTVVENEEHTVVRITDPEHPFAVEKGYTEEMLNAINCEQTVTVLFECAVCGVYWEETLEAEAHKWATGTAQDIANGNYITTWGGVDYSVAEGCTRPGFVQAKCAVCGEWRGEAYEWAEAITGNKNPVYIVDEADKHIYVEVYTCTDPDCTGSTCSDNLCIATGCNDCTHAGRKLTVTCKNCDYKDEKDVSFTHSWATEGLTHVDATCLYPEYDLTFCTNAHCAETKEINKGTELDFTNHVGVVPSTDPANILKVPTCTEDGQRLDACQACGAPVITVLPATGHTPAAEKVPAQIANCMQKGWNEHEICVDCDATSGPGITVPKVEEEKDPDNHVVAARTEVDRFEGTCSSVNPWVAYECDTTKGGCGTPYYIVEGDALLKTEQAVHRIWDEDAQAYVSTLVEKGAFVAPTCNVEGSHKYLECSQCGTPFVLDTDCTVPGCTHETVTIEKNPNNHVKLSGTTYVSAWVLKNNTVKLASCTADGLHAYSECSECGAYDIIATGCNNPNCTHLTPEIPKATAADSWGHGTGDDLVILPYKAPTCSATGNHESTLCKLCNQYIAFVPCDITCTHTDAVIAIDPTAHKKVENTKYVAATCKAAGTHKSFKCEYCGEILEIVSCGNSACDHTEVAIPVSGHDWKSGGAYADPTCTKTGLHAYNYCSVCGAIEVVPCAFDHCNHSTIAIPALKGIADIKYHLNTELKIEVTLPTCTEIGKHGYLECKDCGTLIIDVSTCPHPECAHTSEDIPALGHDLLEAAGQEATCTLPGWTEFEYCQREDCDYMTDYERTEPLGHDVQKVEGVEATCTTDGVCGGEYCVRCHDCEDCVNGVIPSRGGHVDQFQYNVPVTCLTDGYDVYACANCDDPAAMSLRNYTYSLGHVYEAAAVAAGCDNIGFAYEYCTVCNPLKDLTKDDIIIDEETIVPATGHKFQILPGIERELLVDCLNYKTYIGCVCVDCGYTVSATNYEHNIKEYYQAPTCVEAGYHFYACADCDTHFANLDGDELTAPEQPLAATGVHTFASVVDGSYVPATSTTAGSITYVCADCEGEVVVEIAPTYGDAVFFELDANAYTEGLGVHDGAVVNGGKLVVTLSVTSAEFLFQGFQVAFGFNSSVLTFDKYEVRYDFDDAQAVQLKASAVNGYYVNIMCYMPDTGVEGVDKNVAISGENVALIDLYFDVTPLMVESADVLDLDDVLDPDGEVEYYWETEDGDIYEADAFVVNDDSFAIATTGDVTGDGELDMGDLVALIDLLYSADAEYDAAADLDKSGVVDIADLALLENVLLSVSMVDYLNLLGYDVVAELTAAVERAAANVDVNGDMFVSEADVACVWAALESNMANNSSGMTMDIFYEMLTMMLLDGVYIDEIAYDLVGFAYNMYHPSYVEPSQMV